MIRPWRIRCTAAVILSLAPVATAQVSAYHGVSATTHQNNFTSLSNQGYRPLSLSVSGGLAAQRYSAVWVQRGGPGWTGVHGLTRARSARGAPTRSRRASARTWSRLRVKAATKSSPPSISRTACRRSTVPGDGHDRADPHELGLGQRSHPDLPRGVQGARRRRASCGVWVPYSGDAAWGYSMQDTATGAQKVFDAQTEGHARPAFVDISDRQTYSAIWRDDQISSWTAMHDLSYAQFDAEVNARPTQFPLFAQCGGARGCRALGYGLRVERHRARARADAHRHGRHPIHCLDDYLTNLVQSTNARAAAIAIAKDGAPSSTHAATPGPSLAIRRPSRRACSASRAAASRWRRCGWRLRRESAHALDVDPGRREPRPLG